MDENRSIASTHDALENRTFVGVDVQLEQSEVFRHVVSNQDILDDGVGPDGVVSDTNVVSLGIGIEERWVGVGIDEKGAEGSVESAENRIGGIVHASTGRCSADIDEKEVVGSNVSKEIGELPSIGGVLVGGTRAAKAMITVDVDRSPDSLRGLVPYSEGQRCGINWLILGQVRRASQKRSSDEKGKHENLPRISHEYAVLLILKVNNGCTTLFK